jgi:hypothetical protein
MPSGCVTPLRIPSSTSDPNGTVSYRSLPLTGVDQVDVVRIAVIGTGKMGSRVHPGLYRGALVLAAALLWIND